MSIRSSSVTTPPVSITVKAVILDGAGVTIPNAQITDLTHDF